MKKLVQVLALLLVMSFSVSLAQADRFFIEGLSTGRISFGSGTSLSITAIAGIKNIAGPLGIRGGLSFGFNGNNANFGLGAEVLFSFGSVRDSRDVEFFAGGGLGLLAGGGATEFSLNGVVGAEFPLNPRTSVIAQLSPTLTFSNPTRFEGTILAGFRIYP